VLIFMYLFLLTIKPPNWSYDFLVYIPSAILVFFLSNKNEQNTFLAGPVSQFLGRISYSLYMVHALMFWIATQFARLLLTKTEIYLDERSHPSLTLFQASIFVPVIIMIIIIVSYFLFRAIEETVRIWSRKKAMPYGIRWNEVSATCGPLDKTGA
jgi:peptidoglycan/LPS O-acetylase OafA/YrhL